MSKSSGLGAALWVSGYDLSGDVQAVTKIGSPVAQLDVTGIDKYAHERLNGVLDAGIDFTAFFDPATSHPVLSALPSTDVIVTCTPTALGIGAPMASTVAKQIGYDATRGTDGSLTFNVSTTGNSYGLDWGQCATAGKRTDTTGTTGAYIDDTTGTAYGLQAYLHVFGFTGTSCTVKLTHCTTSGGTYTDLLSFSAASAIGAQRAATVNTATVNRFIKVVTTGTFSSCQFAVAYTRNQSAGVVF